MRTYDLDLETVLSLLKNARQTGILSTHLPVGFLGQKMRSLVKITLIEGEVTACHIEDELGRSRAISDNDKKLLTFLLHNLGTRSWQLDISPLAVQPPGSNHSAPNTPSSNPNLDSSFSQNTSSFSHIQSTGNLGTGSMPRRSFSDTPRTPGNLGTGSMPRRSFSDIPRINVNVGSEILQTLSRRHRRILSLVDGRRSAEKIASLLFPTPKDAWIALTLLQEMEAMGIISWQTW